MDTETALQIGRLDGRLDGVNDAITSLQSQSNDIYGAVGRIEERQSAVVDRLDRLLGSGPHPIVVQQQEATERKTETLMGKVNHLLMNPKILHILYPLLALMALAMVLSFYSGRPASEFFRFDQPSNRSAIGPLERLGSDNGPSGKSSTREGATHATP
jgi:hypothetical protein